jgi:hypothetical protein
MPIKASTLQKKVDRGCVPNGHAYTRTIHADANGRAMLEQWCMGQVASQLYSRAMQLR